MGKAVHVAVGIVINKNNEVLLAKRLADSHQGGLWEFPGGKVEADETTLDALKREFQEEVALDIQTAKPFIEVHHDYGDKRVFLDVWTVDAYRGQAHGCEGQEVRWVPRECLVQLNFPKANHAIIDALLR